METTQAYTSKDPSEPASVKRLCCRLRTRHASEIEQRCAAIFIASLIHFQHVSQAKLFRTLARALQLKDIQKDLYMNRLDPASNCD